MRKDAEFLIDLYFSLKNFTPIAKADIRKREEFTASKNMQYLSPVISMFAKNNGRGSKLKRSYIFKMSNILDVRKQLPNLRNLRKNLVIDLL